MNKNLNNPIIKEMWSIINSEKISEKVVKIYLMELKQI